MNADALFKFPVGMLHNTATNRYHPILFRPGPPPSEQISDPAHRFKSRGHHTAGFDTLEEAIREVRSHEDWIWTGRTWAWDGTGVPALVEFFSNEELGADVSQRLSGETESRS